MSLIYRITNIDTKPINTVPSGLFISVHGMTVTPGWSNITLKPRGTQPLSDDGFVEFDAVGIAPPGNWPQVITPVVTEPHYVPVIPDGALGIRAYSATNTEEVRFSVFRNLPDSDDVADPDLYVFDFDAADEGFEPYSDTISLTFTADTASVHPAASPQRCKKQNLLAVKNWPHTKTVMERKCKWGVCLDWPQPYVRTCTQYIFVEYCHPHVSNRTVRKAIVRALSKGAKLAAFTLAVTKGNWALASTVMLKYVKGKLAADGIALLDQLDLKVSSASKCGEWRKL